VTGTLSAGNQPKLGANGTIDSGGCNGFEKGCLESYAVDITTLPEYQKVVKPIGEKMVAINDKNAAEDDKKNGITDELSVLAKSKVWYFVPTSLDQIPSDKLGVAFSTEQLALQSKREIWIDAKKYQALSDQAKGELLLHELVMAQYLIKYMTQAEIDKVLSASYPLSSSVATEDIGNLYDKANPPPKFEGLNKEDYENIRGMTRFVLENSSSLTNEQFKKAVKRFSFPGTDNDDRDNYDPNRSAQPISYDGGAMLETLELAQKSGDMPKQCLVDGQGSPIPCQVSLKISDMNQSNAKYLDLEIKYHKVGASEVVRKARGILFIANEVGSQQLFPFGIYGRSDTYFSDLTDVDGDNRTHIELKIAASSEDYKSLRILGFSLRSSVCIDSNCVLDKNNLPIEAAVEDIHFTPTDLVNYQLSLKGP